MESPPPASSGAGNELRIVVRCCCRISALACLLVLPRLAGENAAVADQRPEAEPLAVPIEAAAPTLFSAVPPEESGVIMENGYADPKMWWARYREFSLGAIGTGVAVGDYDGDGRPDIYAVSKTESNRLFRNLGDWRFEEVTDAAGVGGPLDAWSQGAAFVDVDNDG